MKYWKEDEISPVEKMDFWKGDYITKLEPNEVFVFGANPQARHFAGAAKAALGFGAVPINVKQNKPGIARGLSPNNKTYALITKSLEAGYTELETGITYHKEGFQSVSPEQIRTNIDELYEIAKSPEHKDKKFLITYQYETWPNGTPKKSLNGYTSQEMFEMFTKDKEIPPNIVFHESYKEKLEELYRRKVDNKQKEYIFFFHLTSPFSNFHPAKFEYKDLIFISNEQFMMYSKAKTFGDEVTAQKIIEINNEPLAQKFITGELSRDDIVKNKELSAQWQNIMMQAKKLGRGVKNYNEEVWNQKRSKVVLFGARLKFTQNEDLKKILIDTGDKVMVEASKFDLIWSCGLNESDAKNTPSEKWPGHNLLGKVLDKVKSELRVDFDIKNKNDKITVVNFYHLGKKIPEGAIYIGRYSRRFNLKESKFANQFVMSDSSNNEERVRVIKAYKEWLWSEIAENKINKKDLLELSGKKLVCYCSPKSCHGDILKETVELLINNEREFDNRINGYNKKIKP